MTGTSDGDGTTARESLTQKHGSPVLRASAHTSDSPVRMERTHVLPLNKIWTEKAGRHAIRKAPRE